MDDSKQMNAIQLFCAKPYREHGKKRSHGEHDHDWAYLVRQIAYFGRGKGVRNQIANWFLTGSVEKLAASENHDVVC